MNLLKNLFRLGRPKGRIVSKMVKCGKSGCHCALPGDPGHGPYLYREWHEDGRPRFEYLGKDKSAGETS